MDLLIIVSTPKSGAIADALGQAANRARVDRAAFFTNDGVKTLADTGLCETLTRASRAIACHDSWRQHMGDTTCPIESGSQTSNSELVGSATRIVSL